MEELTDGLTVPERFECFEKARVLPCFASSTLETVPFFFLKQGDVFDAKKI